MLQKISSIIKGSYLRNIFTLSIGSIAAQFIVVVFSPILTRIYSPEEMGNYTLLLSISAIFIPILSLRYEIAITKADEKNVKATIMASFYIACFIIVILTIISLVLFILKVRLVQQIGGNIFWCLPIIFISGIINILSNYNNRIKQYKILAKIAVIRSVIQSAGQALLGLIPCGVQGLFVSLLLSLIFGIKKQFNTLSNKIHELVDIRFTDIKDVIVREKRQFMFSAPSILINTLSYSLINIFINEMYSLSDVGFYSLSYRVLGLPITFISASVSNVFFQKASNEYNEGRSVYSLFIKTSLLLLVVSFPIFIILALFSQDIFGFVFGTIWSRAGLFVVLLSPMYAIRLIVSPMAILLTIMNKQKVELLINSIVLVEMTVCFYVAKFSTLDVEFLLLTISILYALTNIALYAYLFKLCKHTLIKC